MRRYRRCARDSSNGSEMASTTPARDPLDLRNRFDLREENGEFVAGEPREQRARRGRCRVNSALTTTRRRLATMISSWSPRAWPRLSLTILNRSRSTNSIADFDSSVASLSSLSASDRKCSRLGSDVTGSYMPSAWAFSIDARTSANRVSTAAASFGMVRRTEPGAGEMRSPSSTASSRSPSARQGTGAFAVRPFGRDVADQQAEGSRRPSAARIFCVELGQVEQARKREEEGGSAGGTRQDRVADLLGRACFHRLCCALARRQCPPTCLRYPS